MARFQEIFSNCGILEAKGELFFEDFPFIQHHSAILRIFLEDIFRLRAEPRKASKAVGRFSHGQRSLRPAEKGGLSAHAHCHFGGAPEIL